MIKKEIKGLFSLIGIVTLVFEIIFQIGSSLLISYGSNIYTDVNIAMMVAGGLGLLAGFLILGYSGSENNTGYKRFTILNYIWLIFLLRGLQFVSAMIDMPLLNWLYDQGYGMETAKSIATGSDIIGITDIIYAFIGAPIIEECFFRGLLFNKLRKCGTIFAITITAFLFGLMHSNIYQFFVGLIMGIFFAWIRATYGLRYSILVHASNNLLATVLNSLTGDSFYLDILWVVTLYGGILAVIVSLILNFKKIPAAFKSEPYLLKMYGLWFTTVSVDIVTILYVLLTVSSIFD